MVCLLKTEYLSRCGDFALKSFKDTVTASLRKKAQTETTTCTGCQRQISRVIHQIYGFTLTKFCWQTGPKDRNKYLSLTKQIERGWRYWPKETKDGKTTEPTKQCAVGLSASARQPKDRKSNENQSKPTTELPEISSPS